MIKAMVLLKKTVLEAAVGLGRKVAGLPASANQRVNNARLCAESGRAASATNA